MRIGIELHQHNWRVRVDTGTDMMTWFVSRTEAECSELISGGELRKAVNIARTAMATKLPEAANLLGELIGASA